MSEYSIYTKSKHWPKRLLYAALLVLALLAVAIFAVRYVYDSNLRPVSDSTQQKVVVVDSGDTVPTIASKLKDQGLIRQVWAFERYIASNSLGELLKAGTYKFSPSESVQEIADSLIEGKVAVDLITIVPGSRLMQIKEAFLKSGFDPAAVDAALQADQYADSPALADKPAGASLEGFLYPDSYQKSASTEPQIIIEKALDEMRDRLTPDRRAAFARQGLGVFQAVTLASIIEREVSNTEDRKQAAQVFLKRLDQNIALQSDPTALYGAVIAGQSPSLTFDSPYNTYTNKGLPPGPISNVSESSLEAVANPATTDWLYFVAGDNGQTYFSKTLEEHEALTRQYCRKLCN